MVIGGTRSTDKNPLAERRWGESFSTFPLILTRAAGDFKRDFRAPAGFQLGISPRSLRAVLIKEYQDCMADDRGLPEQSRKDNLATWLGEGCQMAKSSKKISRCRSSRSNCRRTLSAIGSSAKLSVLGDQFPKTSERCAGGIVRERASICRTGSDRRRVRGVRRAN